MGADALERAAALLLQARSVVLASHVDPDGDAIGSLLGLAAALDAVGSRVTVVSSNGRGCPATYAFLPGSDRLVRATDVPAPDVFVALDSPLLARLGDAEPLAGAAGSLIAIDHHPDAAIDADVCVFEDTAAATGMLIWQLVPLLGVTSSPAIATCLYTALLSDTGRFSYSNTTAATLRAAADMIDAGADPHAIYVALYESRSPGAQALIARTLEHASFANGGAVVYSWIDATDFVASGALPEESENLIDNLRPLAGIEVAFFARVEDRTVKVSLRAKDAFDVGAIARSLGGGGHRAAAGFTFSGTLDGLLATLLPMLPGGRG